MCLRDNSTNRAPRHDAVNQALGRADDPELLRTVLMLLRTVAIAASIRTGSAEVATAEEKIAEALKQLEQIGAVKKIAGTIQKNALKIETQCTSITTSIHRLLDQALGALAGADGSSTGPTFDIADPGAA
jgi:hypothetical protein